MFCRTFPVISSTSIIHRWIQGFFPWISDCSTRSFGHTWILPNVDTIDVLFTWAVFSTLPRCWWLYVGPVLEGRLRVLNTAHLWKSGLRLNNWMVLDGTRIGMICTVADMDQNIGVPKNPAVLNLICSLFELQFWVLPDFSASPDRMLGNWVLAA